MWMFYVEKVKLVIWDLDDTLWHGTISEEDVDLPDENILLVRRLTDQGIMNSICSKNDYQTAQAALQYAELWDFFIFPKISWQPKGENIRIMLKEAHLRAENVLFIDDNPANLEEAQFYNPGIMLLDASRLPEFIRLSKEIPLQDQNHERLKHYKMLETRKHAQEQAPSNLDFLRQSRIYVKIISDIEGNFDRIHELVQRTNQLNFTKLRSSKETLKILLEQPDVKSGCVQVTDRYGDYGIVGFYAVQNGILLHFLFSCRIMGMGVEQWVYANLGSPKLNVAGEVSSNVEPEKKPEWIQQAVFGERRSGEIASERHENKINILMTGGCDLMSLHYYLQDNANIDTEFDYVSPKTGQYATSMHSEFLVQSLTYSRERKKRLSEKIPFYDDCTFSTRFFEEKYDIVVTSILNDCTRAMYYDKEQDVTLIAGDNMCPWRTQQDWRGLLQRGYDKVMSPEMCDQYYQKFQYVGGISPEHLYNNLEFIREHLLPKTLFVIINAVELPVVLNGEKDRHKRHIEINLAVKMFCEAHPNNVAMIDINQYVHSRKDLADTIRHYQRNIYFQLAQKMIQIIQSYKNAPLVLSGRETKTPADRLLEVIQQKKQIAIYGATRQGIHLYDKLKNIAPILVDHIPAELHCTGPQIAPLSILSKYHVGSLFVIVMDRHENNEAIQNLKELGFHGYDDYVIWPNYIWE